MRLSPSSERTFDPRIGGDPAPETPGRLEPKPWNAQRVGHSAKMLRAKALVRFSRHLPTVNSLNVSLDAFLQTIVLGLSHVPGVVAIVVGGSHARGTARSDSDLDIGLYCHERFAPEIGATESKDLEHSVQIIRELWRGTTFLEGASYLPRFKLQRILTNLKSGYSGQIITDVECRNWS
jgi:predicted nucleotidyltransferase